MGGQSLNKKQKLSMFLPRNQKKTTSISQDHSHGMEIRPQADAQPDDMFQSESFPIITIELNIFQGMCSLVEGQASNLDTSKQDVTHIKTFFKQLVDTAHTDYHTPPKMNFPTSFFFP